MTKNFSPENLLPNIRIYIYIYIYIYINTIVFLDSEFLFLFSKYMSGEFGGGSYRVFFRWFIFSLWGVSFSGHCFSHDPIIVE